MNNTLSTYFRDLKQVLPRICDINSINNNNNKKNNKNLYSYSKYTNINYNSLYITR